MSSIPNPTSHRPAGFSLFDLIGVLAISGVLAAVTFPVFAHAREKATESFCMAGRSQFIRATAAYAEDYDEAWVRSPSKLAPYVRPVVYSCPTDMWAGPPRFCETRDAHEHRGNGGGRRGGSANLLYHNGPVMKSGTIAEAIFWGTSWNSSSTKIADMDTWYNGVGGTSYLNTTSEYTDTSGSHVSTALTYTGHVIDNSPSTGGGSTSAILNEVCKVIGTPAPNGFYAVYVDTKRGNAGYCAWHSYGSCNGHPTQFAFFFNLDGDPGCDPQDNSTGHSQGSAAIANVSGHELSETVTDPALNAWYDRQGSENGDKCAWTFGAPYVTFSNQSIWKIQGNWSNAANNARRGYNGSGCIQTQ